MAKTHFSAEGEVTFRSILFIPSKAPNQMFQDYGKKFDNIKVSLLGSVCPEIDTNDNLHDIYVE